MLWLVVIRGLRALVLARATRLAVAIGLLAGAAAAVGSAEVFDGLVEVVRKLSVS